MSLNVESKDINNRNIDKIKSILSNQETINREENIDSRIQLVKKIGEVHSRISDNVSADFVFAKYTNTTDKEGTINMTNDAYHITKIINLIIKKSYRWIWSNNGWKLDKIDNYEIKKIEYFRNKIFDSCMNKPYMTAILNRNVKDNYLVRIIAGFKQESENVMEGSEDNIEEKGILGKIKKKLFPIKQKEEEGLEY